MEDKDFITLKDAINKWGEDAQIEMIKEECIELALALQKLSRERGEMELKMANVIDEIADVSIMIAQAREIFGADKVDKQIDFKMNRLKSRLEEGII